MPSRHKHTPVRAEHKHQQRHRSIWREILMNTTNHSAQNSPSEWMQAMFQHLCVKCHVIHDKLSYIVCVVLSATLSCSGRREAPSGRSKISHTRTRANVVEVSWKERFFDVWNWDRHVVCFDKQKRKKSKCPRLLSFRRGLSCSSLCVCVSLWVHICMFMCVYA